MGKKQRQASGRKGDNYLDYVPVREDAYRWEEDTSGIVTIYVENTGFWNQLFQKLLSKPKVSQIHLEQLGSFIWPRIDGTKTIYQIGQEVKEQFGEEAEPLYPRLSKYMKMLQEYGFIRYRSKRKE